MPPLTPYPTLADGALLAATLPSLSWGMAPELATALACIVVPLLLWYRGRREPDAVRRLHGLLALCGLVCGVVFALGWLSFAGPDKLAAPLRIAVPVVVWAAA